MRTKKYILNTLFLIFATTGVLTAFLLLTDPKKVALPLLILPFTLIEFIIYKAAMLALKSPRRSPYMTKIISIGLALIMIGILVLSSLGQLTWRDLSLMALFIVLFFLYLGRADFLKK